MGLEQQRFLSIRGSALILNSSRERLSTTSPFLRLQLERPAGGRRVYREPASEMLRQSASADPWR